MFGLNTQEKKRRPGEGGYPIPRITWEDIIPGYWIFIYLKRAFGWFVVLVSMIFFFIGSMKYLFHLFWMLGKTIKDWGEDFTYEI